MSNSQHHKEKRKTRAKQKAKENIMKRAGRHEKDLSWMSLMRHSLNLQQEKVKAELNKKSKVLKPL